LLPQHSLWQLVVNDSILAKFGGLLWRTQMHPARIKSAGKLTWRWASKVGLAVAVASVYFLVAYLSLTGMFFLPSEGITLFWAPAGISSGLLIALGGSPARWSVIIGVFVGAFAVPLIILQRGVWLAMIFALCDAAEPLIIAGLVARYFGAGFALDQLGRVFGLLGATIAGTAPSSFVAAVASRLFLGPATPILTTWLHWWTGVAVGVVTLAPLIIGFSAAVREPLPRSEQIAGAGGLLALAAMTGVMIVLPRQLWETVVPGALLFPILLWLAARCRPVFAAGGVLMVSVAVTWATNFGIGHLGNTGLPVDYRILQAQAIILVTAIGAQVLAALFAERRESEARLARSNAMLERERDNKLLQAQAITAAIAHELRQPLAGIATNAHVATRYLAHTPLEPDEIQTALSRIKRDVHRTNELFDSIRALFGKRGQERQPIDLNQIVLGAIQSLQAELNSNDVVARHELATELPLVSGHGAQLQEVVLNLINNAVEAMSTTTSRSRVLRVSTEVRGRDEIAVSVQDSGPGIDPQQLHNVFNAFISTKEHGTGLGLAICRMIVEGHDGQLTASSDGKTGALFQFTLPIGSSGGDAAVRPGKIAKGRV
jgi:signal transduction histidine kinase